MFLELDTPALVIDLDVVRANVAEMAKNGRVVSELRVAARGAVL